METPPWSSPSLWDSPSRSAQTFPALATTTSSSTRTSHRYPPHGSHSRQTSLLSAPARAGRGRCITRWLFDNPEILTVTVWWCFRNRPQSRRSMRGRSTGRASTSTLTGPPVLKASGSITCSYTVRDASVCDNFTNIYSRVSMQNRRNWLCRRRIKDH